MKTGLKATVFCSSVLIGLLGCSNSNETTKGAATAAPASHGNVASNETKQPNIIYILADDLGYGDLGSYGQQKIKTPHLDQLAADGIKFTNHYSGSTVCGPSRASLLTGLHPGHSPIRENPRWTASGTPVELKAEDVTVAEVLKSAGYQTAAIGKWGMADGKEMNLDAMPNQQGFDYFFGYKTHGAAHHYYWHELYKNNEPYVLEGNDYLNNKGKYTHDLFTEEALKYVEHVDSDKPFFLYLAYTIPHLAMTVPEDSKQQYLNLGWPKRKMNTKGHYRNDPEGNTTYAGMVSRMDRDVGRLLELLEQKGMSDNTLIVFTSDNGHEYDKGFFDSNGEHRGHKRDLYEGGIRTPHLVKWPGKVKAGSETDHISAFWDFMPTACELAQVKDCPVSDGISFVPTLLGNEKMQRKHDYLYWEFNEWQGPIQAIRKGQWKLVKFKNKPAELYDITKDVSEKSNVAADYPEVVEALMVKLQRARSEHPEFPLQKVERNFKK